MQEINAICYRLDAPNFPHRADIVGGKALGLAALARSSAPILGGIVVPTMVFQRCLQLLRLERTVELARAHLNNGELDRALTEFAKVARAIQSASLPADVGLNIAHAMADYSAHCGGRPQSWAVRSSCSFEDGANDSFAGVFDSFINVPEGSIESFILKCYASMYSRRCICYAQGRGVPVTALQMAVIVQPAVNARAAGVAFSVDPRTSSRTHLLIESVFGMGEGLVSGRGSPDRYVLCRRPFTNVSRELSERKTEAVQFAQEGGTTGTLLPPEARANFSISWSQALDIGRQVLALERRLGFPVDVEWLLDGAGKLWIVQVRPLQLPPLSNVIVRESVVSETGSTPMTSGQPITDKIVRGTIRWLTAASAAAKNGEVVVARSVDVDWLPLLRNATAVIAMEGGWTSHIAIILREHGVPTIFSAGPSAQNLMDGECVTVDCSGPTGKVFRGNIRSQKQEIHVNEIYAPSTPTYVVCSALHHVEDALRLPIRGIGLVRMEFVINEFVKVHPLAVRDYDRGTLDDVELAETIGQASRGYATASQWYVETLANAISNFASRCPSQPVNLRLPDLLSDDYVKLRGGSRYEPHGEPNPMMGWRGTTKLISEEYIDAFALDCQALYEAIERRRFYNINIILPFCRSPSDAVSALSVLRDSGITSSRVGMMVEIPSNVVLGDKFAPLFDFFLVGPMDLTQFTYAADRKTTRLGRYSNDTEATKEMVKIFLSKLSAKDFDKDVLIGGWPLFKHYAEYAAVCGKNRLKLVELPDRLLELFDNLRALESSTLPENGFQSSIDCDYKEPI